MRTTKKTPRHWNYQLNRPISSNLVWNVRLIIDILIDITYCIDYLLVNVYFFNVLREKNRELQLNSVYGRAVSGSDWLVSLFNGILTLFRLFNAKAILLEEQ